MRLSTRRPTGLLLGGVLAIVAVALALGTLIGSDRQSSGNGSLSSFGSARNALCEAAGTARSGDAARTRELFFDRAHQALHELAAAAQERDRAAAARLLEAKARVEGGLATPSGGLADDLDRLAEATGRALAAVGDTDPGPCER